MAKRYAGTATLAALWAGMSPALADPGDGWQGWGHSGWGWGHMMLGGTMMVAFWVGLILLIVLLVRAIAGNGSAGRDRPGTDTPLDILKQRYARGEIDQSEFEQRRAGLSS